MKSPPGRRRPKLGRFSCGAVHGNPRANLFAEKQRPAKNDGNRPEPRGPPRNRPLFPRKENIAPVPVGKPMELSTAKPPTAHLKVNRSEVFFRSDGFARVECKGRPHKARAPPPPKPAIRHTPSNLAPRFAASFSRGHYVTPVGLRFGEGRGAGPCSPIWAPFFFAGHPAGLDSPLGPSWQPQCGEMRTGLAGNAATQNECSSRTTGRRNGAGTAWPPFLSPIPGVTKRRRPNDNGMVGRSAKWVFSQPATPDHRPLNESRSQPLASSTKRPAGTKNPSPTNSEPN